MHKFRRTTFRRTMALTITGLALCGLAFCGLLPAAPAQAANLAPQIVSLSPSDTAGEVGQTQTFTAVYRDPNGYANITSARFTVGTAAAGLNIYYNAAQNKIFVANDTNTGFVYSSANLMGDAPSAGTGVVAENKWAFVNLSDSKVVRAGNDVTLTLSITPKATLIKSNPVMLSASDASGAKAAWKTLGNWVIAKISTSNLPPENLTLTTSAVNEPHSFCTVFRDGNGAADLRFIKILVGSSINEPSLQAQYDPLTNRVSLFDDAGTGIVNPEGALVGSNVVIENSQGSLNAGAMSVTRSRDEIALTWAITPKSGFSGPKKIFSFSSDGQGAEDGWDESAQWNITE